MRTAGTCSPAQAPGAPVGKSSGSTAHTGPNPRGTEGMSAKGKNTRDKGPQLKRAGQGGYRGQLSAEPAL